MKKVDFYRYGEHKSLRECEWGLIKIEGLKHRPYGLHRSVNVNSALGWFIPSVYVIDFTRKKIIERMYQKSKEIMK